MILTVVSQARICPPSTGAIWFGSRGPSTAASGAQGLLQNEHAMIVHSICRLLLLSLRRCLAIASSSVSLHSRVFLMGMVTQGSTTFTLPCPRPWLIGNYNASLSLEHRIQRAKLASFQSAKGTAHTSIVTVLTLFFCHTHPRRSK